MNAIKRDLLRSSAMADGARVFNEIGFSAFEIQDTSEADERTGNKQSVTVTVNKNKRHNLTTFHLFGSLPVELRLRIWRIVIAQPRLVTLDKQCCYYMKTTAAGKVQHYEGPWEWRCRELPNVMQVNKEAYFETKKVYAAKSIFDDRSLEGTNNSESNVPEGEGGDKAINYHSFGAPLFLKTKLDTVYIPDFDFRSEVTGIALPRAFTLLREEDLPQDPIKYVSISHSDFAAKPFTPTASDSVSVLTVAFQDWLLCSHPPESIIKSFFPNLKTLIFLVSGQTSKNERKTAIADGKSAFQALAKIEPGFKPPKILLVLDEPKLYEP